MPRAGRRTRESCLCIRAFTLVEVLVVTALASLLMALLLPALSDARRQGRRTACLATLRQLYVPISEYADEYSGIVPLGYRAGTKQFNSMVYSATAQQFVLFGLLYRSRYLIEPRVLFCPAERDARSCWASDANPWPPGPEGSPQSHTYAGYGGRPDFDLPDDTAMWSGLELPRLSDMARHAIIADLTALPARLDTRHQTGINMLHGDGSGDWMARREFNGHLSECTSISSDFNEQQGEIWEHFDAH